jgi:hypothetical protein
MAERSNAAVLKTVDCHRSGGSNPSLSAPQIHLLYKNPQTSSLRVLLGESTNHLRLRTEYPQKPYPITILG